MSRLSRFLLRLSKLPPQIIYGLGLGPVYGRLILLLTTTGRESGLPRITPLQYEEADGLFFVASARGQQADWFRNIVANPQIEVRVRARQFRGLAEPITDLNAIADFLELRLRRHPHMIGTIFRAQGLPAQPDRAQLKQYAAKRALVAIRPDEDIS
jgi:deazaflavin-dependent oxidoreductase (nitroreductase family)